MIPILDEIETRVLGALVEKEITTPDYYPLSLNALLNACNQKSNREPVMNLDEEQLRRALHSLDDKGFAAAVSGLDSRVSKYEHRLSEVFNFGRRETALLCVLLLRGPQTPGELRGRAERMYRFEELADVQSTLQRLMEREPPLIKVLPRQPGTKESRYAQLFSQASAEEVPSARYSASTSKPMPDEASRIDDLEQQVSALRVEVDELRQRVLVLAKKDE